MFEREAGGKRDEPSFLIKVMPLLGHAGRPQKKQFSTRILELGTGCRFEGCRGVCRMHNLRWVDAGLDGPRKKY